MPTTNQIRLLPPADENLFEDLCRDLWALIWKDPDAQRNGRKGQSQRGVDVFGIPEGQDQYEGVQAKAYADPLTEKQIQHEVDEAKKFNPPLRKLTIATTAPRDATGQEYARQLDLAHCKAGLYRVTLFGWDDIKRLVQDYMAASRPDLMEKYFGLTTSIAPVQEAVEQVGVQVQELQTALMTRLDVATELSSQEHYHQELNYARTLINSFKPEQALGYIQDCRERFWHTAQAKARYRILHYTGCALYMLGRQQEAGREFIQALQFDPEDETALEYAALGYFLEGDLGNARLHAERALVLQL